MEDKFLINYHAVLKGYCEPNRIFSKISEIDDYIITDNTFYFDDNFSIMNLSGGKFFYNKNGLIIINFTYEQGKKIKFDLLINSNIVDTLTNELILEIQKNKFQIQSNQDKIHYKNTVLNYLILEKPNALKRAFEEIESPAKYLQLLFVKIFTENFPIEEFPVLFKSVEWNFHKNVPKLSGLSEIITNSMEKVKDKIESLFPETNSLPNTKFVWNGSLNDLQNFFNELNKKGWIEYKAKDDDMIIKHLEALFYSNSIEDKTNKSTFEKIKQNTKKKFKPNTPKLLVIWKGQHNHLVELLCELLRKGWMEEFISEFSQADYIRKIGNTFDFSLVSDAKDLDDTLRKPFENFVKLVSGNISYQYAFNLTNEYKSKFSELPNYSS